jgi:hypothetical protein
MKKIIFALLFALPLSMKAQDSSKVVNSSNDSLLRAALLLDLTRQHASNNQELTKQITELDQKLANIDKKIQSESNSQKKVESLVERVQLLEKKDETVSENVIGAYDHNYKSAVINLVFMDRELKPLVLFNASREFFQGLSDVSNPMNYSGYNDWFLKFKAYMDKTKSKDANLAVLDNLLSLTGGLSKGIPLAGPVATSLMSGIGGFITTFGKRDKAMREESEKMFQLTAVLSQFTHDRNLIESEWEQINKELDELQRLHNESLNKNLAILGITRKDFDSDFANELDANKRFDYIKALTVAIAKRVREERKANPDKWKTTFYHQMQIVQSLKVRFGTLTFRIKENIAKYQELIKKYQNSTLPEMKTKMSELSISLEKLNNAFDATFSPQAYIKSANQMYIVD